MNASRLDKHISPQVCIILTQFPNTIPASSSFVVAQCCIFLLKLFPQLCQHPFPVILFFFLLIHFSHDFTELMFLYISIRVWVKCSVVYLNKSSTGYIHHLPPPSQIYCFQLQAFLFRPHICVLFCVLWIGTVLLVFPVSSNDRVFLFYLTSIWILLLEP